MGLTRIITTDDSERRIDRKVRSTLAALSETYTPDTVARISGVSPKDLDSIAKRLLSASQPLVLGTGSCASGQAAVAAELAALLLNLALDPDLSLFDFERRHRAEIAERRSKILDTLVAMDDVELVLLNNVQSGFLDPRQRPHR